MEATAPAAVDSRRRRFRIAVALVSVAVAVVGAVLLVIRSSEEAETVDAAVTLRVPDHPGAVVAGPDALWVALSGDPHNPAGDGRLLRLDLFTGARRPVYLGGEVSHLTRFGNRLIASVQQASSVGQLATVNWRTGAVIDRHLFERPVDQVVVRDGELWALEKEPGTLLRLDPKTLESSSTLRLSPGRTLGMTSGGGYLWVTAADAGELLRIDPETHAIKRAHVGGLPIGIAFAGGNVWVADHDGGKVIRLDPRSLRQVGKPIRVGTNPTGLIAAADSLLVTDEHDGTVLRINVHSGKRVGLPIRIAAATSDVPTPSMTPAGKSVWVSSYASNTLDRIDASTGPDEGGDKVTVRMLHTNDRGQGDKVIDGSLAGTGQFEASGGISGKGKVDVYRTFDKKNLLITLRCVMSDDKGTITYVVKIDAKPFGVARWTITSATKGYAGLHGEGAELDSNNFKVQTLTGVVRR